MLHSSGSTRRSVPLLAVPQACPLTKSTAEPRAGLPCLHVFLGVAFASLLKQGLRRLLEWSAE